MFEWKVEEYKLRNELKNFDGKFANHHIYGIEYTLSREEKVKFLDSVSNGKATRLLELIDKYKTDKDSMPKDKLDNVKTVSLKAWIKKNKAEDLLNTVGTMYNPVGGIRFLNITRSICSFNEMGRYDECEDIINELFHRQLVIYERKEEEYFNLHDEYTLICKDAIKAIDKYGSFGSKIIISSNKLYVESSGSNKIRRKLTIDELKSIIDKGRQVDKFIVKLSSDPIK